MDAEPNYDLDGYRIMPVSFAETTRIAPIMLTASAPNPPEASRHARL